MGIKIGIGFSLSRGTLPDAESIYQFADRVQDLGIDSIWPSDHTVSLQPSLDVHCLMAAFAARTKTVKLGPSVLSLPARNPVHIAKVYASLDHLTGGRRRILCAVGLGGDPRECEVVGVPPGERGARMREGVEVLRKLWAGPSVSHQGRFYQFEDITIEPRPVGGPLDVWIGGNSDLALKRVARYGDGWMPSFITPTEFASGMAKLQEYSQETGRTIEPGEAGALILCHVSKNSQQAKELGQKLMKRAATNPDAFHERTAIGTATEVRERVQSYVERGCSKFILFPITNAENLLEQVDAIGREIIPHF